MVLEEKHIFEDTDGKGISISTSIRIQAFDNFSAASRTDIIIGKVPIIAI